MMRIRSYILLVGAAIAFIIALGNSCTVRAHEAPSGWNYPLSCCSGTDCREVPLESLHISREGVTVPSGDLIPWTDDKVRPSPDGKFHWCSVNGREDGNTICLFVPQGFS